MTDPHDHDLSGLAAPVHAVADGGHGHGPEFQGQHEHDHGRDHGHGHSHEHPTGIKGFLYGLFVPPTHDAADSVEDALEASEQGVRAVKIGLFMLLATTVLQFAVVLISGSVALLADTIHNLADALTAVPLWIAFVLARRPARRRYTYGFGRAEDLAGLFIVAVVALSAVLAGWQSVDRLFHPQPLANLWWVAAAGLVGFAGNEAVAIYRIRIGRRIGSAALVADGVHARMGGFTSLAVVLGVIGVWAGFPLADPIVGLLIAAAIVILLWGTVRSIGRRLMDGLEPDLVDRARSALASTPGAGTVPALQLRWIGHRLHGNASIQILDMPGSENELIARDAEHRPGHVLPNLDGIAIRTTTGSARDGQDRMIA